MIVVVVVVVDDVVVVVVVAVMCHVLLHCMAADGRFLPCLIVLGLVAARLWFVVCGLLFVGC